MAWLSRVNFISSDTLSFSDINNLGNDIRAWGDNVNGGGYTLSNVAISASSGTMGLVIGGTGTTSTLRLRSTSGVGTTGADIIFQAGNNGATEVMRLQNGGNVGIGTASPGVKLDVAGTAAVDYLRLDPVDGTNEGGEIQFVGAGSNGSFSIDNYAGNCRIFTLASGKILDVVGGSLSLSGQSTGSQYITIGSGRSSNGFSYIDLVGDTTYSSFGTRLIRGTGGANTATSLQHRGTGEFQLFAYEAAPLVVYINSGEKVRIDSSGNVGIGTASPAYQLQLSTDSAAKPTTNTWTIASDARLKAVKGEYQKGLAEICQVRPVSYEYNGKAGFIADGKDKVSILAQELMQVFPECVDTFKGKLEEDGPEIDLYNYNGHAITFALINAIKELKAKIDILEARN
jgi:hypothetical protein